MNVRLKSDIWVQALLRRVNSAAVSAYVMKKGDRDGGIILVKVSHLDGMACLYLPEVSYEQEAMGERIYRQIGPLPEADVETRIGKRLSSDPDLWIVEIEDKQGRHFLTETIITDQ